VINGKLSYNEPMGTIAVLIRSHQINIIQTCNLVSDTGRVTDYAGVMRSKQAVILGEIKH
jgi:hypothetical protein